MGQLVQLITSLTKDEKRKFKLDIALQKSKSNYIVVYEEIIKLLKSNQYDEDVLIIRLKRKGITTTSIPGIKSYLFNQLLKSLRSLQEQENGMEQAKTLLSEARVLERKGIYNKCIEKLNQAKELGYKYEHHLIIIEALKMERVLCLLRGVNKVEQDLDKLHRDITRQIKLLEAENIYRDLLFSIVSKYRVGTRARDLKQKEKIKALMENKYLRDESLAISFLSKISYNLSHALLYLMLGDKKSSNACYKKLLDIWLGHPHFILEYPMQYIIYVSNYLIGCHTIKKYEPFERYLPELETIRLKHFNEKAEAFQNIYFCKVLYLMNYEIFKFSNYSLNLPNARNIAAEVEMGLIKYKNRIVKSREIAFYHNITILFFTLDAYEDALTWIDKILNLEKTDQLKDIQLFARLIRLLIYTEKEGFLYIENAFKSFNYHLKNGDHLYNFEGVVTKHLKNYAKGKQAKRGILQAFKEELLTFEPNELPYFEEINIWVTSKLKNISFYEELKYLVTKK